MTALVRVDAHPIPTTRADLTYGDGAAVGDIRIRWGRSNALDQHAATTCTMTFLDRTGGLIRDVLLPGSPLTIRDDSPLATGSEIFHGRIAQLGQITRTMDGLAVTLTATDDLSRWSRLMFGASPWPAQTVEARVAAIGSAAGIPIGPVQVDATAPTMHALDVDNRSVTDVLGEVATSTRTQLLPLLNPSTGRPVAALRSFPWTVGAPRYVETADGWRVEGAGGANVTHLHASDINADDIAFETTPGDIVTGVRVRGQVAASGADIFALSTDGALVDRYGENQLNVNTQIEFSPTGSNPLPALALALRNTVAGPRWRMSSVMVEDADPLLLRAVTRVGRWIVIDGIDPLYPAHVDGAVIAPLVGGEIIYRPEHDRWDHALDLGALTPPPYVSALRWAQLPAGQRWGDLTTFTSWHRYGA